MCSVPNGEKPADLPEMNGQAPNGEKPADLPEMKGQAPGMIDFDAMVTKGVISQETCDKIKAYMEAHKPADLPEMNGEKPADLPEMNGEKPAESETPEHGGLLADLLKDGVITQTEYDALVAAQK